MPVVAADEFDDFTASGIAAGQPDGGHGGFRAGVDHAHFSTEGTMRTIISAMSTSDGAGIP